MGHDLTLAVAADAHPSVGLGHVARCSGLASALAEHGIPVRALALGASRSFVFDGVRWEPWDTTPPPTEHGLVLDTYLERLPDVRPPLLVRFEDGAEPPADCDIAIGLGLADDGRRLLGGLRHLVLRRDYWHRTPRSTRTRAPRVLVTLGGTDPEGRGHAIATGLASAGLDVTLVRGPAAPPRGSGPGVRVLDAPASLAAPLAGADVAVTGAGQTLWEACAVGTPAVAVVVAGNQRPGAALAAAARVAVTVPDGEADTATAAALDLVRDVDARAAMAERQQRAVDGRGALRVASAIAARLGRR